ncbi:hypothetical protein DL766_006246 [Monosporascus sp. MC13-8B]|uniref:Uncharacterized protein n=1 Tax=Monosporascus cannonballus TaxID=155416 RepID=A0ABY0H6E6_9PEZI|nr:hypothetical protein DL762_006424 [Monosporascus cannonballus]RYO91195.1 hypothetical protein DL763_005065 [Monosporascus cannonballus]RYP27746.1 hypothetical protein DL766_006246 [Monosporascus sp. MC13-8B]
MPPSFSSLPLVALAMASGLAFGNPISPVPSVELTARQNAATRPPSGITCSADYQPNFNDLAIRTLGTAAAPPYEVCVNPNACRIWKNGNCRISFCNKERSKSCQQNTQWDRHARSVIAACRPGEGGYDSPDHSARWTEVAVRANYDWFIPEDGKGIMPPDSQSAVIYQEMSIEENAEGVKRLEEASVLK